MAVHGADVAELRALAKNFTSAAQQLDGVRSMISNQLGMPLTWRGPDAQRFSHLWEHEASQRLTFAAASLNQAAAALQRNATEQEVASGVICVDPTPPALTASEIALRAARITGETAVGEVGLGALATTIKPLVRGGAVVARAIPVVGLAFTLNDVTGLFVDHDQGGMRAIGARHLFGKEPHQLTDAQLSQLDRRYEGLMGKAHQISDQMDNVADKVGDFFKGIFGG